MALRIDSVTQDFAIGDLGVAKARLAAKREGKDQAKSPATIFFYHEKAEKGVNRVEVLNDEKVYQALLSMSFLI